jgi:hypothetical protein
LTNQSQLNWGFAEANDFAYDSFEFTLSGSVTDQGNLSSVNGFALPMGVVIEYASGTTSATSATLGYAVSGGEIFADIQNINSNTSSGAIYNYTSGPLAAAGEVRMALSPSEAVGLSPQPSNVPFKTTDWAPYVDQLAQVLSGATPPDIELSGQYIGGPDAGHVWHNGGYFA